ncbi:MAG: hypothetical protein LH606_17835 [Cytophagaceae bacterium]|nr:hypothetical protein [Cytophagaceae bacterium]
MKRLLLGALCLLNLTAYAQRWESRIGLNVGPLLSYSLEANYEVSAPNRHWNLTADAGYSYWGVHHEVFPNVQTGEQTVFFQGVRGPYAKLGGRYYFFLEKRFRPFVGVTAILSRLRMVNTTQLLPKRVPEDILCDCVPPPFVSSERRGSSVAVGGLAGMTTSLGPRLRLDLGVQA